LYINNNPFLHTISQKLQFRTIAPVMSRSKNTMLRELGAVIRTYRQRGFDVKNINGDHEFECIKDNMLPIDMGIVDKDDHVPEVEQSIRAIKERVRCTIAGLPLKKQKYTLRSFQTSERLSLDTRNFGLKLSVFTERYTQK
jgi:hypothetical protein